MKFKLFIAVLTVSLALSGFLANPAVAETLQEKLEKNQEKQSSNQEKKEQTKEEIEAVQEHQEKVNAEIERLDKQIMEARNKISTKETEIKETRENIERLKQEIAELEKRIAERDELLKDRVRSMHQNGGAIDYIDVLMGAESFGNFLERVISLNTIAEQDREILEQHKADKEAVEAKKAQVEEELASLEEKLAQLEDLKAQLDSSKKEKDELLQSLEREEEELHNHVMSIEEENATLAAQEKAMKQEIERQRKEAERREAERRARERAQNSSSNSGSSSSSNPPAGSSTFAWPANAPATSEYGYRVHPIYGTKRLHSGIDLAAVGTIPIYASADGTVIRSYYSSSYGNVVFIAHQINGQTYTTVYAHMRSTPAVSSGQTVQQGDFLGNMGSTGDSTGQHLHFEIHEGSWNGSRSNSVNPRRFLP
ncbi:peptidoglycan DD-metalloendopeptidase family protein [Halobacillus litoralis]|uniref:murein hydrolase activator EnvC family protein n=1 Tax=Halobacillus litoralis TaxID=45668 RepID=UPI001CD7F6B1|nr:M23 family metallopeptidase [Halobacillus litoralis]MCA0971291.1 peptidoglycan DD-metalloendopeptidase family protein [Halobacillus litoralis]